METINKTKLVKSGAGFTLIELLVVIAIIGLLASVILVALNSTREKARDVVRKSDMHTLELAILQYYDDNNGTYPIVAGSCASTVPGDWPGSLKSSLAPYISKLPIDPVSNNASRHYAFCQLSAGSCSGQYVLFSFPEGSTPVDSCLGAGVYSRSLGP